MVLRIALTLILAYCYFSCKEKLCGEIQLGDRFVVALEEKRNQIIYCTTNDYCCNSGLNAVPMGVTDYGFDDRWIIARTSADKYWIIDKDLKVGSEKEDCYKILVDHIKGNLGLEEFDRLKKELGIEINLINVE